MNEWNNRPKYTLEDATKRHKGIFNFTRFIKRELNYTFLSILGFCLIFMGSSYAIFSSVNKSTDYNVINIGTLQLQFNDTEAGLGNIISLNNALPVSDTVGKSTTPYTFKITNTGTLAVDYTVKILNDQGIIDIDGCSNNLLPLTNLKYSIDDEGPIILSTKESSGYLVKTGTLAANTVKTHTLRLWIDDASGNEVLNKHYHGKIVVEGLKNVPPLLADELVKNLGANGTVYEAPETKVKYIRSVAPTTDPSLVNNYVWWSGMMWRIFAINPDGSMKIITDDNVSALPFYDTSNVYATSHIKQWLETYFYPKLNGSKDTVLKQNNDFCIDSTDDINSMRTTCTNKLSSLKVGLLTLDEYNIVKNGNNTNYLNNGTYYWLMTPHVSNGTYEWFADSDGGSYYGGVSSTVGGRVVTVFAQAVTISSGNGTLGAPYKITGDIGTAVSGTKLNLRHTGEFITYDNKLWRIMETVEGLTKVIYDGATKLTTDAAFGSNNLDWATMKTRLDGIGISTVKIAQNQTWQRGYMAFGDNALTTSLASGNPVTSTFGLPKVGEMWSSQNNNKTENYTKFTAQHYWLMTPHMSLASSEWLATSGGGSNNYDVSFASSGRIVFFFASTSTISSGDGTPNSPYILQ